MAFYLVHLPSLAEVKIVLGETSKLRSLCVAFQYRLNLKHQHLQEHGDRLMGTIIQYCCSRDLYAKVRKKMNMK